MQNVIPENINIGNFGIYLTYSNRTGNRYEVVKWHSKPYTKQLLTNDDFNEDI